MEIEKNDANISFNNYLSKVNSLIMSHVPIKQLNKQQQKFLQKPWFTTAILNFIHKKNKRFKKYIKFKILLLKMIYIENIKVTEISYPQL